MTTHRGSLARPTDLLETMDARLNGKPYDLEALYQADRIAVNEVVGKQLQCGVDIVTDGEQGKPNFNTYMGYEPS